MSGRSSAGPLETVQVHARFAQPAALAHDLADAEGAADQSVDVDAPGEDVAAGPGEVERVAGCGELVEDFAGDQGQVVTGAAAGAGTERTGTGGVAVTRLERVPRILRAGCGRPGGCCIDTI